MNKVILMGRLTAEPEIRHTTTETPVATYTLAVDRRRTANQSADQPTADFIRCVTFGKGAEFVEGYLHKGTKMLVTGRIQTSTYTNKDGQRAYSTDVIVDEQEFAESKSASGGTASGSSVSGNGNYNQNRGNQRASYQYSNKRDDSFMNLPDGNDEELPFN